MTSCATPGTKEELQPRSGYACCNLHYQRDKISDANWQELPFFAAGTPVTATGLEYDRAYVRIAGSQMYIRQEYGREQETLGKKEIQDAIRAGRVMQGMTKEQLIVSLGYPMTSYTSSPGSPVWKYWVGSFDPYEIVWGPDGRVQEIRGEAPVRARVFYQPGK